MGSSMQDSAASAVDNRVPPPGTGNFKAIVDCNSFYCSAERVFRPDLATKPVVVLSNNDGCIVSRTDEAKALGIDMAIPYFQAKPMIEKAGVITFSSNYNLYGDMSWRVMETLRRLVGEENVEVYSVDESFLDLRHVPGSRLYQLAADIRTTVEQWTGVAVSVGIAPTKTLSKVANRLAKKNKQATQCVYVLDTRERIDEALSMTRVNDIWGVGGRYAEKLRGIGIDDAYQLSRMPEAWARKNLGGVVGVRLIRELRGEPAIIMHEQLTEKKMIATTRMFGTAVSDLHSIREAVATYTSRAAEKLRRQYGAASTLSVFLVQKEDQRPGEPFRHGPTLSTSVTLPHATSATNALIKAAMALVEKLYRTGMQYKKAGVLLSGIVPDASLQGNLFVPAAENRYRLLMDMMDNVNFSMRNDILKFAASGMARNWKMRQELRSPRYTSRWDELREVK